jgi:hypothetical protein
MTHLVGKAKPMNGIDLMSAKVFRSLSCIRTL